MSEFYKLVPKDRDANLRFRYQILKACYSSKQHRAEAWEMCRQDILFFLNTFCWLLEPRIMYGHEDDPDVIPFITHRYQDEALLRVQANLGKRDIAFHKSRATGATWMILYTFLHQLLFIGWKQLGVVSRNMDVVNKPDSQGALMSKLCFALEMIPMFLGGGDPVIKENQDVKYRQTHATIANQTNRATITGFPATGEVATGDRLFAILMDEFHKFVSGEDYFAMSSAQHATHCRIFVSTPDPSKGESGAFFDIINGAEDLDMELIEMSWMDDPDKRKGLYKTGKDGFVEHLDWDYDFPPDYPYILDGKIRSPYYDGECVRPGATKQSIAAELDRSFSGSTQMFFETQMLDKIRNEQCCLPYHEGRLSYDDDLEPTWVPGKGGELALWINVDDFGMVPTRQEFVIAADVASGRQTDTTSNSVAIVMDMVGQQVAEFVTDRMTPDVFAKACVSLAKWFNNALLNWDASGATGGAFTEAIIDLEYENMWFRPNKTDEPWKQKTQKPGYAVSPRAGFVPVLQKLQEGLLQGTCVIRSKVLVGECRQYVYRNGVPVHVKSVNTEDESSKKGAHGDRVIAGGLAYYTLKVEGLKHAQATEHKRETPRGSFLWRREQAQQKRLTKDRLRW